MYADFHGFVDALVCLIAFHVVKTPKPIVNPKAILDTLMSERLEEIFDIVVKALEKRRCVRAGAARKRETRLMNVRQRKSYNCKRSS